MTQTFAEAFRTARPTAEQSPSHRILTVGVGSTNDRRLLERAMTAGRRSRHTSSDLRAVEDDDGTWSIERRGPGEATERVILAERSSSRCVIAAAMFSDLPDGTSIERSTAEGPAWLPASGIGWTGDGVELDRNLSEGSRPFRRATAFWSCSSPPSTTYWGRTMAGDGAYRRRSDRAALGELQRGTDDRTRWSSRRPTHRANASKEADRRRSRTRRSDRGDHRRIRQPK